MSGELILTFRKLQSLISESKSESDLRFLSESLAVIMAEIILKIESLKKTKCHLRVVRQDEV